MSVQVSPLVEEELAEALAIDRTSGLSPWNERDLARCLHDSKWLLLGARHGAEKELAGFALALLLPPDAELLKIAVLQRRRRRGVATALLQSAILRAGAAGCLSCALEIRSKNRAALKLYERFGFQKEAVRRGYYRNPDDDAWVMKLELNAGEDLGQGWDC